MSKPIPRESVPENVSERRISMAFMALNGIIESKQKTRSWGRVLVEFVVKDGEFDRVP